MELAAEQLTELFQDAFRHLNERQRRILAGAMAKALGRGGKTAVATASGMSRNTIIRGEQELAGEDNPSARVRKPGAGAKRASELQPGLRRALEELVQPEDSASNSPLRWTVKSSVVLAKELDARGFKVSDDTVRYLLDEHGYTRRLAVGHGRQPRPADPNAQFAYVNATAASFVAEGEPALSVDVKAATTDFRRGSGLVFIPSMGQPIAPPDAAGDSADWGRLADDSGAARLMIGAIRRWWTSLGVARFPAASRMLVSADTANPRARCWAVELARLARATGLDVTMCHMPPGTWKWSRTEHRLSTVVVKEWEGGPATAHRTVVKLVSAPGAATVAKVPPQDNVAATDALRLQDPEPALGNVALRRHELHGDWNYTVSPIRAED